MIIFAVLVVGFNINLYMKGQKSLEMPNTQTFDGSSLGNCSEKPNCVSSFQDKNDDHYIAPLKIESLDFSLNSYKAENFKIIKREDNYLYATFTSSVFSFVDDIELYYNSGLRTVYFRSASRVGYSDLGANRKRVEEIKEELRKL